jgi:hypothetical protein
MCATNSPKIGILAQRAVLSDNGVLGPNSTAQNPDATLFKVSSYASRNNDMN